jgi:hypothetical protein
MTQIQDTQPELPELDGDITRCKVLFADGVLLDCETGATRMAVAADRMGHKTACPYIVWSPAVDVPLEAALVEFYSSGAKDFNENEAGKRIIEYLTTLARESRILRAVKDFAEDWNMACYLLRMMARALAKLASASSSTCSAAARAARTSSSYRSSRCSGTRR